MAAANSSGGVMGKMIDAQSIVVASTATQWYGHEGDILRYVFFHSLALAALVGLLIMAQAYVYPFTRWSCARRALRHERKCMAPESLRALTAALAGFIPAERLITDPLRLIAWGTDASFYRLVPAIAVVVESEDEVRELLAVCDAAPGAGHLSCGGHQPFGAGGHRLRADAAG